MGHDSSRLVVPILSVANVSRVALYFGSLWLSARYFRGCML